jgi:tRNA threonylcarbamoyladenosine modification (KEOPS) complex  Pcc1 subunit
LSLKPRRSDGVVTYSLQLKVEFEGEKVAETIFRAIYSDVRRERIVDATITLECSGSSIIFTAASPSYARFRGVISTFLRLVGVSEALIHLCQDVQGKDGRVG